jgi:hypothetical protein
MTSIWNHFFLVSSSFQGSLFDAIYMYDVMTTNGYICPHEKKSSPNINDIHTVDDESYSSP